MTDTPLVSVSLVTYNHGPYIGKALDSVLMQETTFPFEVCLGEDESSDGTREICREYAARYPDKIRLFLRSRSDVLYIEGRATGRSNAMANFRECRGAYIALLEGDDFWTDPRKLQKQVAALTATPNAVLCGHNTTVVDESGTKTHLYSTNRTETVYEIGALVGGFQIFHTSSVLLDKKALLPNGIPELFWKAFNGDTIMLWHASSKGRIIYIPDVMSCKRIQSGGVYSRYLLNGQDHMRDLLSIKSRAVAVPYFDTSYQRVIARGILLSSWALFRSGIRKRKISIAVLGLLWMLRLAWRSMPPSRLRHSVR
jgi:glycosyltransferase involved in cell wall biosynthesis